MIAMNIAALDIKQLHYFVHVVDAGSISKASGNLHIAQAALSKRITTLEHVLRCQLLHRSSQGVMLTDQGAILYRAAQRVLREVRVAAEEVASLGSDPTGIVTLGCSHALAPLLAVPIYVEVKKKFPAINLMITERQSSDLLERLRRGSIDIAIASQNSLATFVESKMAIEEELFLIEAPVRQEVEGHPAPITVEQLRTLEFVQHSSLSSSLSMILREAFEPFAFSPKVVIEIDSIMSVKRFVKEGLARGFLTWSAVRDELTANSIILRRVEPVELRATHQVCVSAERPLPSAAAAVLTAVERVVRQLISSGEWQYAHIR